MTEYEKHIYVDGSCCHQKHKGSWAVIDEENEYSGALEKLDLDSEYCELFAIYQALLLSRFDTSRVVIHSDNPAVVNLNKSIPDFYRRVKRQGRKQLKNLSRAYILKNHKDCARYMTFPYI